MQPDLDPAPVRDRRLDLLRGLALLAIFVDHVPYNVLHAVTMQSHGLSDAADIFVFLSGYGAWSSFEDTGRRAGERVARRRLLARCGRIYLMQAAMLVAFLAIAGCWCRLAGLEGGALVQGGLAGLAWSLLLYGQPNYLDILPLYLCLLLAFPLLRAGLRRRPAVTLLLSAGCWVVANLSESFNLPELFRHHGWTFNPLEWQLLFVLGAATAAFRLPWRAAGARSPWIAGACWTYLATIWLLLRVHVWLAGTPQIPVEVPWTGLGTDLPRLASALSVMYLTLTSRLLVRLTAWGRLAVVEACGRHALAVFGAGSILALVGRLTFRTAGYGPLVQVVVNVVGLSGCLAVATLMDRWHRTASAGYRPVWRRARARMPTPRAAAMTVITPSISRVR